MDDITLLLHGASGLESSTMSRSSLIDVRKSTVQTYQATKSPASRGRLQQFGLHLPLTRRIFKISRILWTTIAGCNTNNFTYLVIARQLRMTHGLSIPQASFDKNAAEDAPNYAISNQKFKNFLGRGHPHQTPPLSLIHI